MQIQTWLNTFDLRMTGAPGKLAALEIDRGIHCNAKAQTMVTTPNHKKPWLIVKDKHYEKAIRRCLKMSKSPLFKRTPGYLGSYIGTNEAFLWWQALLSGFLAVNPPVWL